MRCSSRSVSRFSRRPCQPRVRLAHRLGAGALPLSRPQAARRDRRHSVRVADGGRRHRADQPLCGERLARRPARPARHQGRIHAARHLRRAGVHRPAVRRAHRAAGAGRPRKGAGGGRSVARRKPLDHRAPRRAAEPRPGAADRLRARARARGRRVRLGDLHRRQSAERVGDRAAADRHQAAGIPLRRRDRDRGRDAACVVPAAASSSTRCSAGRKPAPGGARERAAAVRIRAARRCRDRDRARAAAACAARSTCATTRPGCAATIIALAVAFLGLFIVLPLVNVFAQAFSKGVEVYFAALTGSGGARRDPAHAASWPSRPSCSTASSA